MILMLKKNKKKIEPSALGEDGPINSKNTNGLIFVLGDSRTGTLSLHNYFLRNNIRSIHYFIEESGNSLPLHLASEENEKKALDFIRTSDYQAFSDYPTRYFFKQLIAAYPNAYFILTVRESIDRWANSMTSFFKKFNKEIDIKDLRDQYETTNELIRKSFNTKSSNFLEICIDADSVENSYKLADFLGLTRNVLLSRDNATDSIDVNILSKRHRLYSHQRGSVIDEIEKMAGPSKAIFSEFGWAYLVNDSNEFLRVQFNERNWDVSDRAYAAKVIKQRKEYLLDQGAIYRKFIIPEKSVIYREYLPRAMENLNPAKLRPAHMMAEDSPDTVSYLESYLIDARSYGLLYFRGDTHTNWLGGWFVYRYIVDNLSRIGLLTHQKPFDFRDLVPSVASYNGDLSVQVDRDARAEFDRVWGFTTAEHGFEVAMRYELNSALRVAQTVEVPSEYQEWFNGRETFVYERSDKKGLKAVIFRDSTFDFCHEYLAQHFSRSVFIWHQGQVYVEVIEREQPDVVIHVMAERFIVSYNKFPAIATIAE
jgi:hypothetical protein